MLKRTERREELKKTLKRNKRKHILIRVFVVSLLLCIIIGGGFFFINAFRKGVFNLKHVKIIGNEISNEQNITEVAQFPMGKPIFLINYNEIKSNINSKILTSDLYISLCFPDTLVVRLKEQQALCAVIDKDRVYYLNDRKEIIGVMDYIGKEDIPVISGIALKDDIKIGSKVKFDAEWRFEEIKNILEQLTNSGSVKKVSEIIVSSDKKYTVITKNNLSFIVSGYDNFKENFDYIETLIDGNYSGLEIDFVTGTYPILKEK